ncbi:UDP-N-acetylglucosamine--N-acetylmuramyl-(pentapeptide) pyrophosphoryl-undecaprenol N-acetylglucosamine transferase [Scopulibacillus daqui]|uniref:UDP-N-acetylglucosamine--N-acetylmuramyl-(pentapeptide) pyrophosphoryl-undecaprenol N-acetylglucosamine transferase n=1 Tax=Scopulibacillus daqui TaxID=1469162 RepID=A0ABS2PW35_9BACL|nr:undecaprenyldiphospho-muramoylpentapeptide beta-N-acetylglucosaminyltransferase [Scopulibacillus daqui]MBM7644267.1 UDP-N-acetylglucosamine--N-acetylmuramyl-(pentapeptide) pyrophosphoryl-undecaprenol N-acetylglucosamine transferase [Scopulibacillus daqui]
MKVMLSGGGTGGHIYPAIAVINEIKRHDPDAEFLYVGAKNGLEQDIVKRENIPFESLHITGFKRKLSFENVKTITRFLRGVSKSKKLIKRFKPDVIIGTGGYVCGPVVYAGAKLGVPTIIHEQNSIPGLTNKFLSRYVDRVAVSFKAAEAFFPKHKVILTGNPRASEVLNGDAVKGKKEAGLSSDKKTVLIFGGSRGARPINDAVVGMLQAFANRKYQVLYITGNVHYENVMEKVKQAGSPSNVFIKPFIHNMPDLLAGTDLVVSRAGATTIAELTALGVPSILIPSPYVTNNHQEKNAEALAKNGASIIIKENDLNGQKLLKEIDSILENEQNWKKMHEASISQGMPDAAARVRKLMNELANK